MNISSSTVSTLVYTILAILAFAAEQFHIVPSGTTNVILALITGHAVGTTTNNSSNNVAPVNNTNNVSTPSQG